LDGKNCCNVNKDQGKRKVSIKHFHRSPFQSEKYF
jgi:hypothetical protein